MSTYCGSYSKTTGGGFFIFLLLLLVVIAGGLLLAVGDLNEHAVDKHGNKAVTVAECAKNGGVLSTMINPTTNRQASICGLPDGKFGVYVSECNGDCATSFIKDKMKKLEDVIRYLKNVGYKEIGQ
jgi:hypothetical protein